MKERQLTQMQHARTKLAKLVFRIGWFVRGRHRLTSEESIFWEWDNEYDDYWDTV
ncbi:MAG: hypothetical protein ACE5FT_03075 [Candidatus Nanoarchaeia archaeon]